MSEELTAQQIKEKLMQKKTEQRKAIEPCQFAGVEGWLFRSSAYEMEGWRLYEQSDKPEIQKLGPAKLVQISFCDKNGKHVFTDAEVPIIAGFDDGDIRPILNAALRINGYSAAGAETILKNLKATFGVDGLFAALANIDVRCPVCSANTKDTSCKSSS